MLQSYLTYILVVGIVGSVVSYLKNGAKIKGGLAGRIAEGCFTAYVVYEIVFYHFHDLRYSLGICGIGAWMGVEGLVFIRDTLFGFLKKKEDSHVRVD